MSENGFGSLDEPRRAVISKEIYESIQTDARAELLADKARLVVALRELHDLQNGPPLFKYEAEWRAAMLLTKRLLDEYEPPTPRSGEG